MTMNVTRLKLPAVRHFVESTAWAIHPEKGAAMLEILELHAMGGRLSAEELKARVGDRKPATKSGGAIAVLPLYGVVAQRMDLMMEFCGGTSTERFSDDFDAAMADPGVSAIVIDCDSPGGSVPGTPELAKRILAARGKGKTIVAVSNGLMASAAYWICSAADEIVCTPSGEVGSIGVFTVHVDQSAMNEMVGLKYTLIRAGEHKAENNPWEPLSADAEAFIQSQVDEFNTMFVSTVAKQRGTDAKTVNADYGQGRCFTAKQALAVGMIDRIATLEDTLKRLGAKNVGASGRPQQALGASEAVIGVDGTPVTPSLLSTDGDGVYANDAATPPLSATVVADEEEDDDEDLCPDCGGDLDEDDYCATCKSQKSKATKASTASETTIAAEAILPSVAGAAEAGQPQSPDSQPHAAKEQPMNEEQLKAALEAERKRGASIRALARDHGVDETSTDAMIDSGMTYEAATTQILANIRDRHTASPNIRVGDDRSAAKPFTSVGEQLVAIVQAGLGRRVDPRLAFVNRKAIDLDSSALQAGTPSGMSEGVGSEGGFFIQNDLLPGVIEPMYSEDPILSRVTRIPIGQGKNGVRYNVVDEKSRVDGSRYGGIQMFWGDEADTATATKPKLRQVEQALKKLIGIAYLTDELLEDAPASEVLLVNAFQNETKFMLTNAIFRGRGGGQPLGFMNTKAVISQAIEATQTIANSSGFLALNVTKMLANIPAALWPDVIFEYNQELLPYLVTATIGGGSGAVPVFIGAGGLGNRPFDTILGRPAFVSELCEAPGTPGDIVAMAPSQFHLAEKSGAQMATSVHVRFLYDETALRLTYRVDGKPVWNQTVTPFKGTSARAPFVTLAVRA